MRCLRKFQWVKLFRDNLPEGKGILGFWAKLAACAAYRNGTSLYCGFENEVKEVDESVSTTKEMEKNLFIELFKKYKKFTKLNREILETFVKKITVYSSKSLEIEWNFNDDLIELVNMAQEKGIELVMNEQNTLELPPKGSHRNIS